MDSIIWPKATSGASLADLYLPLAEGIVDQQPLTAQAMPLVHHVLEQIKFSTIARHHCGDAGDVPAEVVLETLIHARISNSVPVPLSRVMEWAADTVLPYMLDVDPNKLNDERLGRVLAKVGPLYQSMYVQLVVYAHETYGLPLVSGLIYDRTAVYFEGEYKESKIAKRGKSKDGKPDAKQLTLGLNVTREDAVPVLYDVLPGNTTDCTTVVENMKALQKLAYQLHVPIDDILIDGDSGMLTPEIIRAYEAANVGYIGTMQESSSHRKLMDSISDEKLLSEALIFPGKDSSSAVYAVRTEITFPPLKRGKRIDEKELTQTALVVLSMSLRQTQQESRSKLCHKLEGRLSDIRRHLNTGSYHNKPYAQTQVEGALKGQPRVSKFLKYSLSGDNGNLSLDWIWDLAALEAESFYDGKYLLFTNRPNLTNEDLLARHKQKDGVEKRFAGVKGPLTIRPIFLHNDDRILGLTFVVMVALLVGALIELKLKRFGEAMTMRQVHRVFESHIGALTIFNDGSQMAVFGSGSFASRKVLAAFALKAQSRPVAVTAAWAKKLSQARGERYRRI